VAAGCAVAVVVGGAAGAALGAGVGVVLAQVLGRLEPRSVRLRREQLAAQAPEVAELLAACLSSGAPIAAALRAVSAAVGPPVSEPLAAVLAQTRLGADPATAWASLAAEPALAPLARAVVRSTESGAPVADSLVRAAGDLRAQRRGDLLTAARTAGVTAVLPLGVCFLPSFALLGVVPVVASLAAQILDI
jgi:pilus assembly protein TadC